MPAWCSSRSIRRSVLVPRLSGATMIVLSCHASLANARRAWTRGAFGVPRIARACRCTRAGSFSTDHRSPLEQRWGGWYVTGTHGASRHMGNQVAGDEAGTLDPDAGANVTDLTRFLAPGVHLTPHSDLVALMVLEHQVRIINLITRVGWETRWRWPTTRPFECRMSPPASGVRPPAGAYEGPAEVLVRSLVHARRASPGRACRGHVGFAEEYSARGPRDRRRRRCTSSTAPHGCIAIASARSSIPNSSPAFHRKRTRTSTGVCDVLTGRDRGARLCGGQRRRARGDSRDTSRHPARSAAASVNGLCFNRGNIG